jgi:hypothetical protein
MLGFAEYAMPEQVASYRLRLDPSTAERAKAVSIPSDQRDPSHQRVVLPATVLFAVPALSLAVFVALKTPTDVLDVPPPSDSVAVLTSHVPSAWSGTCSPLGVEPELVAAVTCRPPGTGAPSTVEYRQYASNAELTARFESLASGIATAGTCDGPGRRDVYSAGNGPRGSWACYRSTTGNGQVIWTDDQFTTLGVAFDRGMTTAQVYDWWSTADVILK